MQSRLIVKTLFLCAGVVFSQFSTAGGRAVPVTEPSSPAQIEQRLENIERLLQNQSLLDMLQQIQRLQQEVTNLRGQLEVNNYELENLKEKQRKLYNDIDNRLQQLAGQGQSTDSNMETTEAYSPPLEVITPTESVTPAGNSADSSLTVENVPATSEIEQTGVSETEPGTESLPVIAEKPVADNPLEIQAHYQEAFRLLKQADYDQAITAFDRFLGKYPDSQYSDNAQYWLGEAYYVTRRFDAAITEYMKLISNYPQSQRVPNSLLKIGYSYFELGQPEEAKKVLQSLMDKYPGSSAAADAATRLKGSSAS